MNARPTTPHMLVRPSVALGPLGSEFVVEASGEPDDESDLSSSETAHELRLRKKRYRLVLPTDDPQQILPLASIGFDSEGGMFIAPVDVFGQSWHYGTVNTEQAPTDDEMATTAVRPKLMWHRSGRVHASLSGATAAVRRLLQLSPFDRLGIQVLSVVGCWPMLFATPASARQSVVDVLMCPHGQVTAGVGFRGWLSSWRWPNREGAGKTTHAMRDNGDGTFAYDLDVPVRRSSASGR